jgi:hypothetical protein
MSPIPWAAVLIHMHYALTMYIVQRQVEHFSQMCPHCMSVQCRVVYMSACCTCNLLSIVGISSKSDFAPSMIMNSRFNPNI